MMTNALESSKIQSMDLSLENFRKTIEASRQDRGWSRRRVANESGVPYSWIVDVFRNNPQKIDSKRANKVLKTLGGMEENRGAVLGEIGANDEIVLVENYDTISRKSPRELKMINCETYLAPADYAHQIVHVWKVKKEWEGFLLGEGSILYTTEITYKNFGQFVDSDVIVHLKNGRTLIKKLINGSVPGKYSLAGVSVHGFMRDAEILWCAEIVAFVKKKEIAALV